MKNFFRLALILLAATSLNAKADPVPTVVDVQFRTGYLPVGFDTNDNSQLVAEGTFPNTCYRHAGTKMKVDHDNRVIRLFTKAYKYKGNCLPVLVPFQREVDLGLLKAGTYKVVSVLGNQQEEMGNMQVSIATNSEPDDFLYAPVSQAYFSKMDGKYFVTISGMFPQTCYKMREVVVRVQPNVLVVQPIAEMTDEVCEERLKPYSETVEVKNLSEGRYLLHIRSLNGEAVNNLIDVR
jgi:hypothetical protein